MSLLPAPDHNTASASRQLRRLIGAIPTLFTDAGQGATWSLIEYFTAHIRNPNTRAAYARAVRQFSDWCAQQKLSLHELNPFLVAAYIEDIMRRASTPTVKQHLAALRVLFDYLVVRQVLPANPAGAVRGPKHVVKKGKTPVLTAEETRELLDSIDTSSIAGLRNRALIAVMVFSFARVSAVIHMRVEDYFQQGKRFWFRLHEKGGKRHDVPAHHKAEHYIDEYLAAAGISEESKAPLFRTLRGGRNLTDRAMQRREALAMIKRRTAHVGLPSSICCHTFRATGITAYLLNGGTLERAQQIAAHESPRTTKLYDRTSDEVSLDEIEKILI